MVKYSKKDDADDNNDDGDYLVVPVTDFIPPANSLHTKKNITVR